MPLLRRYIAIDDNEMIKNTINDNATQMLISDVPRNPYRKALTIYRTGLPIETFCQNSGNNEIE